jgi:hypothetical protein
MGSPADESFGDGIPAELERIVSKCLEKDLSRRYPNAFLRADLARGGVTPVSALTASESAGVHAGIPAPGLSHSFLGIEGGCWKRCSP